MEHETRGVHVSAGDGIVAHVENLTAFAAGDEGRLNELLVRINALAGAPWQEIVRTLTADIAQADYNEHPRLACVSVEHDRVAALVFGDTSLSITIDGAETVLDGRDSSTWIDVALRGSVERIHAGTQSESAVVGVLRDGVVPAGGFLLDTAGPMPASGRWSEMASAAAAEAAEDVEPAHVAPAPTAAAIPAQETAAPALVAEHVAAHAAEPVEALPVAEDTPAVPEAPAAPAAEAPAANPALADAPQPKAARGMFARIEELGRKDAVPAPQGDTEQDGGARLFDGSQFPPEESNGVPTNGVAPTSATEAHANTAPTATLAPERPQIRGVLCPNGHLTAPNAATCRTCHTQIATDAATVSGDRPVLGILTFDDGAVLNIDRPAAIGSNVPSGYTVETEPATIVRLDDGAGGVSDVQVEVHLSGWTVEIVDMQSANGTYTSLNGERQTRTKLRPGQRVALQHDMTIETGGRSFVFTSGPGLR